MASISARPLSSTLTSSAAAPPSTEPASNNANFSVQELCSSSGVCRAWNQFTNQLLIKWLVEEMHVSKPIIHYENIIRLTSHLHPSVDGDIKDPTTIINLSDLKTRIAAIMTCAPPLKVFTDFTQVLLIARATSIHNINGRKWLAIYTLHDSNFEKIRRLLSILAFSKKVALGDEMECAEKAGRPIKGYFFGLEDQLSKKITWVLACQFLLLRWNSMTENGTLSETTASEEIMTQMNNQFYFPFDYISELLQNMPFIESLTSSTRDKINQFRNDPVVNSLFLSYMMHNTNRTMRPQIKKTLSLEFFKQRSTMLLDLLKALGNDCCHQLVVQRQLTTEIAEQVTKYLSLPDNTEKTKLWYSLNDSVFLKLRNKAWMRNIHAALPYIPKKVPHILFGGASHISSVLRGMTLKT